MTRSEVILALARTNFFKGDWSLDDDLYDPVSAAFVIEAWSAWVEALPDELKTPREIGGGKTIMVPKWLPECFDCDNIAIDFAVFLDRCLAVDAVKQGKTRGNLAGGRFNFFRGADPTQGHCRNWFVDFEGVAHAFDAGSCQMDGQSPAETATIFSGETI